MSEPQPRFSHEEIMHAFTVLESLREFFKQNGGRTPEHTCNEAHALIQEFVSPVDSDERITLEVSFSSVAEVNLVASQLSYDADHHHGDWPDDEEIVIDEEHGFTENDVAELYRHLGSQLSGAVAQTDE